MPGSVRSTMPRTEPAEGQRCRKHYDGQDEKNAPARSADRVPDFEVNEVKARCPFPQHRVVAQPLHREPVGNPECFQGLGRRGASRTPACEGFDRAALLA